MELIAGQLNAIAIDQLTEKPLPSIASSLDAASFKFRQDVAVVSKQKLIRAPSCGINLEVIIVMVQERGS